MVRHSLAAIPDYRKPYQIVVEVLVPSTCSPRLTQTPYNQLSLVFVPNRAGAGDVFLNRWRVARVANFSRSSDCHFQFVGDCNLGIRRAGSGDLSSFGLQCARRELACAGHIRQEFVNLSIK
jgi:hypothetical protein